MMRPPPHPVRLRDDAGTSRPKEARTWAQRERLRKRHEIKRQVYVKVMVRNRVLTELEAEQQFDSMWRRP